MTDQKTNIKAQVFASQFNFQEGIFNNSKVDLTDELADSRPNDNANHMKWITGHILHCRYMLANMLGAKIENPFGEIFWNSINEQNYPKLAEIYNDFPKVSQALLHQLNSKSDEELDQKPSDKQAALSEIISFFAYHEAYHLGQLGMVRKIIGMKALKSH